jgi:iron(III)-enterobactin esterase
MGLSQRFLGIAVFCGLVSFASLAGGQSVSPAAPSKRPQAPTRDPHTAGYAAAKELPDGEVPPANADGNFIIGPTHPLAPEMAAARRPAAP